MSEELKIFKDRETAGVYEDILDRIYKFAYLMGAPREINPVDFFLDKHKALLEIMKNDSDF